MLKDGVVNHGGRRVDFQDGRAVRNIGAHERAVLGLAGDEDVRLALRLHGNGSGDVFACADVCQYGHQ